MDLRLGTVVVAFVVSVLVGLVFWAIAALVFKRPDGRQQGFIACVVTLVGLAVLWVLQNGNV